MPIYEYRCKKCKKTFEELVFGGQAKVKCPGCGSRRVERALSVFGVKSGGKMTTSSGSGPSCTSCGGGSCSTCH